MERRVADVEVQSAVALNRRRPGRADSSSPSPESRRPGRQRENGGSRECAGIAGAGLARRRLDGQPRGAGGGDEECRGSHQDAGSERGPSRCRHDRSRGRVVRQSNAVASRNSSSPSASMAVSTRPPGHAGHRRPRTTRPRAIAAHPPCDDGHDGGGCTADNGLHGQRNPDRSGSDGERAPPEKSDTRPVLRDDRATPPSPDASLSAQARYSRSRVWGLRTSGRFQRVTRDRDADDRGHDEDTEGRATLAASGAQRRLLAAVPAGHTAVRRGRTRSIRRSEEEPRADPGDARIHDLQHPGCRSSRRASYCLPSTVRAVEQVEDVEVNPRSIAELEANIFSTPDVEAC